MTNEMIKVIDLAVKWVLEQKGPTKKELYLKISELEKEVARLSEGEKKLLDCIPILTQETIANLKEKHGYNVTINIDSIVITGVNSGTMAIERTTTDNSNNSTVGIPYNTKMKYDDDDDSFFVTDEDLIRARIKKK